MNADDLRATQAPLITLDTDASDEQLTTLLCLTERYCVVYQTLRNPPAFAVSRQPRARP